MVALLTNLTSKDKFESNKEAKEKFKILKINYIATLI